jgi:hypothetical protein
MTIVMNRLEVSDERLLLDFDIRNDSRDDTWFCESSNIFSSSGYEVFADGQTLVLRKRLDVPTNRALFTRISGRYVRLGPGDTCQQTVLLDLPAMPAVFFADAPAGEDHEELRRLAIEIGFYAENLPGLTRGILAEAARFQASGEALDAAIVERYFIGFLIATEFGGLAGFEQSNRESDLSREVVIPYTYQALKGEQCARLVVDGIAIPYK